MATNVMMLALLVIMTKISAWTFRGTFVRKASASLLVGMGVSISPFMAGSPSIADDALCTSRETCDDSFQVEEASWQETWAARAKKASTMSRDEIFLAAKGAGKRDASLGPESSASKKRRALAGCRSELLSQISPKMDEKVCVGKAMKGDTEFILEVLDK